MSKLYIFAIGGTGSRVLKSLTMLLASGFRANTERIIPMIIDTDTDNGDLELCRKIVRNYQKINNKIYKDLSSEKFPTNFFRTYIEIPKELNISGRNYGTLLEMIDYNGLSAKNFKSTKELIDTLFSSANKEMNLEKGFMGTPNVGSIVLKDVVDTQGFREFTQEFKQGDRIFIVGSIFGGTGAAGFPLLLNILRDPQSGLNNAEYINNAVIGGISILPYFEVDVEKYNNGESAINSNTFITKTKAALSYYNKYIIHNINALFYLGDSRKSNYENNDGGIDQKNPASFIEFAAALSILRFLDYDKAAIRVSELQNRIRFFEFGIETDELTINLKHLGQINDELLKQLITFMYFSLYFTNYLGNSLKDNKITWINSLETPGNYDQSDMVQSIRSFLEKYFYRWVFELQQKCHSRQFIPFNLTFNNIPDFLNNAEIPVKLTPINNSLFNLVNDIPAMDNSNFLSKDRIAFDQILNEIVDKINSDNAVQNFELRFIQLLQSGIAKIYLERFKN